ncbi:hypothetical protein SAMN05444920_11346 [Nonomuraea solani]|uniref:Excreted virulence factor EspC, type VII ESX diderm n=1 Tax=Nonomuraea solani TaxID=1144553 RepID=A0A1H6EPX2_9ACTN|nr:hypothetical protein [Nonomuraea solani]SEG99443.1 hypothetical protein SAMN05444920_11346 [Nonomuraea solani]
MQQAPSKPPVSGQEIYVTSSTIAHTRKRVDEELGPAIQFVHAIQPMTAVDGLGFGAIGGMVIGGAYEEFRRWLDTTLTDAEKAVQDCSGALDRAKRNWRAAEEASIVRYR